MTWYRVQLPAAYYIDVNAESEAKAVELARQHHLIASINEEPGFHPKYDGEFWPDASKGSEENIEVVDSWEC